MDNVLYVNKPKGITSFDVCYKLRKILNTKKIGHTGTLDPNATGVMIVLYDKATKANQFLVADNKEYIARVLFGMETDTLDIDGNIINKSSFILPNKDIIIETLDSFLGISKQEVPITSSIKVDGKKLYEYQRSNLNLELPIRDIEIFDIELLELYNDGFSFRVCVSSGTYIRALVRDILKKLDLIGTLSELCRTKINDICIEDCDSLDDILNNNYKTHNIYDLLKSRYEVFNYDDIATIKNGKRIKINSNEDKILIVNNDDVLAIYQKDNDYYKCLRGLW